MPNSTQIDDAQSPTTPTSAEIAEFGERLTAIQTRIQAATQITEGAKAPTLLAVSKTKPASAIAAALLNGVQHFGENYLQEALEKQKAIKHWLANATEYSEQAPVTNTPDQQTPPKHVTWHYIGNVQSNKTRPLAEHFDWVHTISSEKQLKRLDAQRPEHLPPLNVCLQINIDEEPQKQGISPAEALELAIACQQYTRLSLRGLMCIPPQGLQDASFKALAQLLIKLKAASSDSGTSDKGHLLLDTLSMGMSADLESAIAAGSTIVRIGSALFGERS